MADPGYIADVIAGEGMDPDNWGNPMRDRVVHHFANAADRDASITSPKEGQACWLNDVDQFLIYNGVNWRKPWSEAWGIVAETVLSSSQDINTLALSDITGFNVTFTNPGNRYYIVRAVLPQARSVSLTGDAQLQIQDGSSGAGTVRSASFHTFAASEYEPWNMITQRLSPGAGSVSYHVRAAVASGALRTSGNVSPCILQVEDVGPSGAAA
jgi:hypothetical protein